MVHSKEITTVGNNERDEAAVVGDCFENGPILQYLGSTNERVVNSVHNSAELFVQLGPGPLQPTNVPSGLPPLLAQSGNDSISNWGSTSSPSKTVGSVNNKVTEEVGGVGNRSEIPINSIKGSEEVGNVEEPNRRSTTTRKSKSEEEGFGAWWIQQQKNKSI